MSPNLFIGTAPSRSAGGDSPVLVRCCAAACFAGLALLALLVAGCSGDGLTRVAVRGKVDRQGRAVTAGSISFLPAEGNDGPAALASISNGEYQFTRRDGPIAGQYRVVVVIPDGHGKGSLINAADAKRPPAMQDSQFESTAVIPEASEFEHDIHIK